jgi:hypothetical protein
MSPPNESKGDTAKKILTGVGIAAGVVGLAAAAVALVPAVGAVAVGVTTVGAIAKGVGIAAGVIGGIAAVGNAGISFSRGEKKDGVFDLIEGGFAITGLFLNPIAALTVGGGALVFTLGRMIVGADGAKNPSPPFEEIKNEQKQEALKDKPFEEKESDDSSGDSTGTESETESRRSLDGLIIPPVSYSPAGAWSEQDLQDFASFEAGNKLIWTGCTPALMEAKAKFEQACAEKGWRIEYSSAYRPLIYQAHFYDLVNGPASKTPEGQADKAKHGLGGVVAYPNANNAHVQGRAFDCIVYDENGSALNSMNHSDPRLQQLAKDCGLNNNIPKDYVDFRLP